MLKIKNYEIIRTYFQRDGLSIHMVTNRNGQTYFLRLLDEKENPDVSVEKWYDLYEHYVMTVTNYKHLPRVNSIDSNTSDQVFTTFPFVQGQFINDQYRLNRDEVDQLLDAVSHLHTKGLVHGSIGSENIWLTDDGSIILFGTGEVKALGKEGATMNDDLQQLIWVLSNYSELDQEQIQNLQRLNCNDVEDIRLHLQNSTISPGLVEKREKAPGLPIEIKERKTDKQVPPTSPSTQKNQNEAFLKKKAVSRWILGGVAAVIVLSATVWCGSQIGGMTQVKPASSENSNKAKTNIPINKDVKSTVKKSTPPFNQTALDTLAPSWELKKSQIIQFQKQDVIVAGISNGGGSIDGNGGKGKVIVVQYDSTSENWVTKWSGDILADGLYPFYEFQSIFVTKSTSQKRALALIAADVGGSTGYGQALALTIDENGTVTLKEKLDIDEMSIKQKDTILLVSGSQQFGMHELSLQGENYFDTKTAASQQTPAGAVQVTYKLDNEGNVVLLQQKTLNIKVGQTIAFVPADTKTKQAFDSGNVEIFTNGGQGSLNTSNADRIGTGNSYACNLNGTVQFLLITPEKDTASIGTTVVPTLTVNVQP